MHSFSQAARRVRIGAVDLALARASFASLFHFANACAEHLGGGSLRCIGLARRHGERLVLC